MSRKRERQPKEASPKKESKWAAKVEKLKAQAEKAKAVAAKRKWLVLLIVAGIAAYFIIKTKGCI